MKLRLDKKLTDLDRRPIMVNKTQDEIKEELDKIEKANKDKPDNEKDKTQPSMQRALTVKDVCDVALLSIKRKLDKAGNPTTLPESTPKTEREARYLLAVKIRRGEDLTHDDKIKLQALIGAAYESSTLVTGQMNVIILEGKHVEHGQFKVQEETKPTIEEKK